MSIIEHRKTEFALLKAVAEAARGLRPLTHAYRALNTMRALKRVHPRDGWEDAIDVAESILGLQ